MTDTKALDIDLSLKKNNVDEFFYNLSENPNGFKNKDFRYTLSLIYQLVEDEFEGIFLSPNSPVRNTDFYLINDGTESNPKLSFFVTPTNNFQFYLKSKGSMFRFSSKEVNGQIGYIMPLDLVLDYFLIYSLDYDLKGAALASVIAQGVAFLIAIIAYRGEFHGISFSKEVFKELFIKALAPFLLNFSYSIIIIITNALCLHYSSIEAVASYTLLSYLLYIISAISTGVSDSIQPLFSYHYALKDIKTNIKMLKKCLLISFSISVVTSLLFYLFRNNLADLYNLSATSRSLYYDGLIFYLIGFLFVSFIKVTSSYLYSIDDKIKSNILILLEPLVLTLLYGIICGEIFGISGIWISFLAIQITLFIISLTLLFLNTKQLKEKIS